MPARIVALAATAAALTLPAAASAASWQRVTATNGSGIDQVSPLRTADGTLHVLWKQESGPNSEDVMHTTISASGKVGATVPVQSGWAGVLDPALVAAPGGGLRAFWGGIRTVDPGETNTDMNTALSSDGGASWALQEGSIIPLGAQSYGSDVAATALPDGTPLQAWSGTLGTWVHSGLDPLTPNTDYEGPLGQYGYNPAIASNSSGAAMLSWFSSAEANLGVYAQPVSAAGTPAGPAQRMPGTEVLEGGSARSRTGLAARAGGGFYVGYAVGYPSANRIRAWRVGSSKSGLIAKAEGAPEVTMAADANGRMWIAWSDGTFSDKTVYARRSNKDASVWGATVSAGTVKGGNDVYAIDGSATDEALDVLALFGVGTSQYSTYVKRVYPGLTLKASRSSLPRSFKSVTFTVLDAGDPVKGATVEAGGKSGTTNSKGKVTFTLRGSARAKASKSKYVSARLRLR